MIDFWLPKVRLVWVQERTGRREYCTRFYWREYAVDGHSQSLLLAHVKVLWNGLLYSLMPQRLRVRHYRWFWWT